MHGEHRDQDDGERANDGSAGGQIKRDG
jgi:hypothetical protein